MGGIFSLEARDMDTKLLSAPESNNTLARYWFRRNIPVTTFRHDKVHFLHKRRFPIYPLFSVWSDGIRPEGFLSSFLLWLVIIVAVVGVGVTLWAMFIGFLLELPEGSIAKGYVAEEALTFSSHYFWDVTIKFNHPDRNVDPPPPNVSVLGVPIGIPEINMYRSQFKSLFPNKDMKEEFPDWFGSQIHQRHVDNDKDPEVSTTSELFALACGPMVPDIH
ncbi:hypothetical protein Tco_0679790 [Tanacetum coccineum]|uniref:DUF4218 domain-containing protein n=1 Tax=Tanacetum coccineum TaxID=301880 RepID=A0ABQ4XJP1_9ASTR